MKNINFSISNLAWDISYESEVIKILNNSLISGVEISLRKYFDNLENLTTDQILSLKNYGIVNDLKISSLQSLLFKREDLSIFASGVGREQVIEYLNSIYKIAKLLQVKPMVFGSPKNRKKGQLTSKRAFDSATEFFSDLISEWDANGPYIAFEANPSVYGCDFIVNNSEAIEFVNSVNSPNLRWHLDYGCSLLAGENPTLLLMNSKKLPSHIHMSEKNLGPFIKKNLKNYIDFLIALQICKYDGVVTFEMLPHQNLNSFVENIKLIDLMISESH